MKLKIDRAWNEYDYVLTEHNLHIKDSYTCHKCKMRPFLEWVKENAPTPNYVFKRSIFSLKMEWICHKFLYLIGYKREQTKDCDLDYPADHPEWLYIICGLLVWLLVW